MNAPAMHHAFIGLGSNLGEPSRQLRRALEALRVLPGVSAVRCSSFYRTRPLGYADQPDFVNAVAMLRTELCAVVLLERMLAIERVQGRTRAIANGPRTLDLDLLLYDALSIDQPGLILPHPRMHERAFVLVPLLEIAPDVVIPGHGDARSLLASLDQAGVMEHHA
jgi:2-amino-4-hydroxy-6-hydroxymethyldihydropteridine diphosphokinase